MFEVVASDWMRNYLKDKREFTDWEKAALIWNSSVHTWKERLDSLKEISNITTDEVLRRQILERISYEERGYQLFIHNQSKNYVYVVFDDEKNSCGYFSDYEMARLYGIKYCEEYDCSRYSIEKQLLYGEKTKSELVKPWVSNNNLLKVSLFSTSQYDGRENASGIYNTKGEIFQLYSLEMTAKENEKVDKMSRQRFEYRFFKFPFGMEKGTIVKMLDNGIYAVLDQGEDVWNEYMEDANPSYYDYSDIQTIVFVINKDGHWSHVHVNPLYLEPGLPKVEEGNKKEKAYRDALIALSSYFQNKAKEDNEKAIKASRTYAEESAVYKNWSRIVYETDDIEKLLF